ncbi:PCMD domain-containing protein [Bacteroides bouchesdurhonensis]|uniref:PCMD domain-containing protein n=1 Tax=Bacteroides bouchesdurhonensis TaxID=1841855 RepID=UPI00097F777F|nr:PCMD domain-containing protein [Bacteroides bouchesdurhonensis]
MKKSLFYLLMFICSVSLFTGCSDDDDDPNYSAAIDGEMVGNYKGILNIKLFNEPFGDPMPQNITISKASDTSIDLSLKNFSIPGLIVIPEIKLSDCKLTQNGDIYKFTGVQSLNVGTLACTINATGTIKNGTVDINMDIKANLDGQSQDVNVTYKGTRLNGNESKEAKIINFTIDNEIVTEAPVINESEGTIVFKVLDEAANGDLAVLVPTITVSDKAVVNPASGVAQDFSNGKSVTYTVVAEDGTIKVYVASIAGKQSLMKYSFEEWEKVAGGVLNNEYFKPLPTDELATSAPGAAYLKLYGVSGLPAYQTDDAKEGMSAIKLVTMDTSAKTNTLVPAITSGSFFTGSFDTNLSHMMQDRIGCTHFGIPYAKRPVSFRGWYKYISGAKFLDGEGATTPEEVEEIPDKKDECSIAAILYEAKDAEGNEITLTGHDINTSEYRVAIAALADGTEKVEYTHFDISFTFFEGKAYDTNKEYKLAIVCSSSKEGDVFKGAGGSTLFLDELEIVGE